MPTLLIVDDRAAILAGAPAAPAAVGTALEPTDLPIAAAPMHGAHLREGAGTLAAPTDRLLARRRAILRRVSPRRAGRSMVATDARTMIDYQHRSPSR